MSNGVLTPESNDGLAHAGGPDWFGFASWIGVAGSLFAGLALHVAFLVVPAVLAALVPARRRDELLLSTLDRASSLLVDGLALSAAFAVSYASGDPTRPMMAWAVLVLIGWRSAGAALHASGWSHTERGVATVGLVGALLAWSSGQTPPTADGALTALVALGVATLLRRWS